uniref:C-type lectin domain-containing protein n=1 Tax=Seriola dumerili TaxID=41447 RepID=A0A3B4TEH9_SERDU
KSGSVSLFKSQTEEHHDSMSDMTNCCHEPPPDCITAGIIPCPTSWMPQGEKCFFFSQDRADWISSQYRCMAVGEVGRKIKLYNFRRRK